MITKINQLRAEADEMGVTPELLALCYIHSTLMTLQGLMERNYKAAIKIEQQYLGGINENTGREEGISSSILPEEQAETQRRLQ
jgi:hypothetical protein